PEPCDFDQNAPSPAVAGLGYSLAPRRRSAVIGARCKTEIRSQLPSAGEGSGEHLASKDCRAGGAHSVQRDEQLSLLFDHRVLRVGRTKETIARDRKSTRLNSSHVATSYAVFCLKKKTRKSTSSRINHFRLLGAQRQVG